MLEANLVKLVASKLPDRKSRLKAPESELSHSPRTSQAEIDSGRHGAHKALGSTVAPDELASCDSLDSNATTSASPPSITVTQNVRASPISNMPPSIFTEILSNLSLADLLSVYESSRQTHRLLSSAEGVSIWRRVRKIEAVPDPPPDTSELGWALLLFKAHCEVCNTGHDAFVDFRLRRRACYACRYKNLVEESKFRSVYPHLTEGILNFIPYTLGKSGKLYWKPEVEHVSEIWRALKEDYRRGKPGAEEKLNGFKAERSHLVRKMDEGENIFTGWHTGYTRNQNLKRFQTMGYQATDAEEALGDDFDISRTITHQGWKTISSKLERRIEPVARKRVAKALVALFMAYLRTLPPNEWLYHPGLEEIINDPGVQDSLPKYLDSNDETAAIFHQDIAPQLPDITLRWREARRQIHEQKVVDFINTNGVFLPTSGVVLDLAIWIFTCTECSGYTCKTHDRCGCNASRTATFFGWEAAKFHCGHSLKVSFDYAPVIRPLVVLAGLDPSTATTKQMNESDLIVYCSTFSPELAHLAEVYSWRDAVKHSLEAPKHNRERIRAIPRWKVLTPEQRARISLVTANDPCWSCNHCHHNFFSFTTLEMAIDHLQQTHEISRPKEGVDMISYASRNSYSHQYVYIHPELENLHEAENDTDESQKTEPNPVKKHPLRAGFRQKKPFKCKHCDVTRQYEERGMRDHLKAKHDIRDAVISRDYGLA